MAKLTQAKADALKAGDRRIVWDGNGLGARITSGTVSWIVDFSDPATGKRTRRVIGEVHGDDRKLLVEARAEAARLRAGGAAAAPKAGGVTFKECWEALLDTARLSLSPATIASYEQRIGYVLAALGTKAIAKITEDDVRKCIFARKGERDRTYAHTLIRMTINWAVKNRRLPASHHNPASVIKKREMLDKDKLKPSREIEQADLAKFGRKLAEQEAKGSVSPWLAALLRLSLLCALRPGEARTLQWGDVDMTGGTMVVRGKTGARKVYLSVEARSVLESVPRIEGVDWCFPGKRYGQPIQSVHKVLHAVQDAAGVPRFRPYDLRHTSATGALAAGADLKAVADLLGHCDTNITNVYLHASDDRKRKVAAVAGRRGAVVLPMKKRVAKR
ncbi:tyrosine-type recombinase/integrase [Ancylobacter terrae]|uniref:tyrosine-type recombinase/integrase n=1 Tax=Ancylobacter sp. sgz301288 TaxID=3342077 RepID=UPI00385D7FD6